MDNNENHQINLRTEETTNKQTESTNPPLMDYMEKPKNKNSMILNGIVGIVSLLIFAITGYYIYNYFKANEKAPFKSTNTTTSEPAKINIVEENTEEDKDEGFLSKFLPGYLKPEANDFEGILTNPNEIAEYNKNGPKNSNTAPKIAPVTTVNPKNTPTETPASTPAPTAKAKPVDGIIADWKPNDYKPGDIKGSSHLVIKGDTLWEISEGKYGQGIYWKKIQTTNNIGYLRNGNPLITPGQNLNLPE